MNRIYFRKLPFFWRVTFSYAVFTCIIFVIFGIVIYINVQRFHRDSLVKDLETDGLKFEEMFFSGTLEDIDFSQLDLQLVIYNSQDDLSFSSSNFFIKIPYREGVAGFKGYGNIDIIKTRTSIGAEVYNSTDYHHEFIYYNKVLFSEMGEVYYFQIAKNLKDYNAYLEGAFSVLLIVILSGIFVSFLVGYVVSKRTLFAVKKIADSANNISFENLSGYLEPLGTNDEFDKLVISLNDMMDRLRATVEHQKQFVSDASHELKTPIAVLEGYANILRRWGYKDKEVFDEAVTTMLKEMNTMKVIVENLLLLARVESQIPDNIKVKVNLKKILFEIEEENQVSYPERIFEYEVQDNVYMLGNFDLLKILIRVFCENAVKYTPKDSVIEIKAGKTDKVWIKIIDHGEGIPDEFKQKVFSRFYRIDESRNRGTSGSGLGLSIAKRIIELHEGEVKIEDTPGGGAIFHILFDLYKR